MLSFASKNGQLRYVLRYEQQTPSNNELREMHYHVYRRLRRQWLGLTLQALAGKPRPVEPLTCAFVAVQRHCAGELDWDNAYGGLKPLLDCLVARSRRNPDGLGFIVDDSPRCLPLPPFMEQVSASPGKGKTLVLIYELSAQPAAADSLFANYS